MKKKLRMHFFKLRIYVVPPWSTYLCRMTDSFIDKKRRGLPFCLSTLKCSSLFSSGNSRIAPLGVAGGPAVDSVQSPATWRGSEKLFLIFIHFHRVNSSTDHEREEYVGSAVLRSSQILTRGRVVRNKHFGQQTELRHHLSRRSSFDGSRLSEEKITGVSQVINKAIHSLNASLLCFFIHSKLSLIFRKQKLNYVKITAQTGTFYPWMLPRS